VRRALHTLAGSILCVDLVRAWVRQLAAASLTALCIPLAVVGALVALTFAGGFGSLGSFGQIFGGPSAAKSAPVTAPAAAVLSLSRSVIRPARSATAHPGANAGRAASAPAPAALPAPSRGAPAAPEPVSSASTPSQAATPPAARATPVAAPAPTPAPHPTIVDRLVGVGTKLTAKLPAPVGPTATQAVQTVGSAVPHLP
jgi:hypothetical protein